MKKDFLNIDKFIKKEFNKPKIFYEIKINSCDIYHINCYGIYKRKKDTLIKRKIIDFNSNVGTNYQWKKYQNNEIFSDLDFAKKIALEKIKKKYPKKDVNVNDIVENNFNKDIMFMSF